MSHFDDLPDFEFDPNAQPSAERVNRAIEGMAEQIRPFVEPCSKCGGSGKFRGYTGRILGDCRKCNGTGKLAFATSRYDRNRAAQQRANREVRRVEENREAFAAEFPDEMGWLDSRRERFGFAASLYESIGKFGRLTDRQLDAVRRYIQQDAERIQQREALSVNVTDGQDLAGAFRAAVENGLKRPVLRIGKIKLSLAAATSRNPGFIYAKRTDGTYVGKIAPSGQFHPSRDATPEDLEIIKSASGDPREAAVRYGRETGTCSCCGRTLTDPASVEAGIGPICASKWGL